MPKHIIYTIMKMRLNWIRMYEKTGNASYTSRYFGISRKTFYKWYNRYIEAKENPKVLLDQSKKPNSHPNLAKPEVVKAILKIRNKTKYGPRRIQYYLKKDYNIKFSICGIYKVLKRAGKIKPLKGRKKKKYQSYNKYISKPGQKIQVDVKHLDKRPNQHDSRDYQYTAKDCFTKIRFIKRYDEVSVNNTVDFTKRMLRFFPFKTRKMQTDHGMEFTFDMMPEVKKEHPLDEFLRKYTYKIEHSLIPVATPRYNGQAERSHRTDGEEFYRKLKASQPKIIDRCIIRWLRYYNEDRPHMGIDMLTPIEKLKTVKGYENIKLDYRCYL